MRKQGTRRRLYRIVVESELDDGHASASEGMRMETREGQTILTGEIKDQPHLFGILDRLNGLGLELLGVEPAGRGLRKGLRAEAMNFALTAFSEVRISHCPDPASFVCDMSKMCHPAVALALRTGVGFCTNTWNPR
jgi:hypothetical protein